MDAIAIQQRYMKLTKKFLIIIGIWPDHNKFFKYISCFIIYIIVVPSIFTQVAKLVCFFSLEALTEQLSFIFAITLLIIKHSTYILKKTEFKKLLNGMFNDWVTNRSEKELAIMMSYMQRGHLFRSIYLANAYVCTILFLQLPWWPRIADLVIPLNASRSKSYIYPAYYFVDENKYYYYILAHMSSVIITTMFVYSGCDTCYIYIVQHACGLLAVVGHRFKEAVGKVSEEKKSAELSNETYKKVCFSIKGHERAIKYLKEIEDLHFGYLFICMGFVTVSVGTTLVMVSRMKLGPKFYQQMVFLIVQLMHIFFLTLQGQFVTDVNDEVYNKIYDGMWYNAVYKTQALYILALRKTKTSRQLTAGGFIPLNLQSFSDIIKTSFSYFTVLKNS